MKIDAERARGQEPFNDANIAERRGRRVVLPISFGEGVAITLEQGTRFNRIVGASQRLAKLVNPGAHNRFDRALEAGPIRIRHFARRKRDDEVDANQLALGKERVESAHPALVGSGEIIPDRLAHRAAVPFAGDVNKDRDETVESVAPRQNSHPRPLVELQHRQCEFVQRVLVKLKQFVARVILEHVDQCLARMAIGIEAGAFHHCVDLAAQVRNGPRGARVGGRREQSDDAELAGELAAPVEALQPHIVHVDPPMHA